MGAEDELRAAATTEALTGYLRQADPRPQELHAHGRGLESVRRDTYRGHDIVVRTTYSIEVDGTPLGGHLEVANNGLVHHHAVPNYVFASAIDLVKQLIDTFPDDFDGRSGGDHGHGDRGGHSRPHQEDA